MCSRVAGERLLLDGRLSPNSIKSVASSISSRSSCSSASKLSALLLPRRLQRRSSGGGSEATSTSNSNGIGGLHFGQALRDQPQALAAEVGGPVPSLLAAACRFLSEEPSLSSEGLFRVEGSRPRLLLLRARLDADRSCDIPTETAPRDVSSTLKAWLRQLPEPLLTVSAVEALARAADAGVDEAAKLRAVRAVAAANSCGDGGCRARSLRLLCLLLHRLAAPDGGCHGNRMDADSLATCVGPCLYGGVDSAEAAARLNLGVALLIRRAADIPDVLVTDDAPTLAAPTTALQSLQQLQHQQRRRSTGSGFKAAVSRVVSRLSRSRSRGRSRSRSPTGAAVASAIAAADVAASCRHRRRNRLSAMAGTVGSSHLSPADAARLKCARRRGSFTSTSSPHPDFRKPRRPLPAVSVTSHPPLPPPPPPPPAMVPLLSSAATKSLSSSSTSAAVWQGQSAQQQQQQQQQQHRPGRSVGPVKVFRLNPSVQQPQQHAMDVGSTVSESG